MNPKIYLIHDSQRKDRRDLFRKELEEQGIDLYELVPADKSTNNPVKNISRAHKECIRRAQKEDLPMCVVMEDDVLFPCPGAYNEFLRLSEILPTEITTAKWDMLIAGSYDYQLYHNIYKSGPLVPIKRFSGLHCYLVRQKFYDQFLQAPEGRNLDKTLAGNIWMTYPMMALQHDGYSDNKKRTTNYNQQYKSRIKLWDCKK